MKGSPFMGSGTSLDPFGTCHSPFTASHTTSYLCDAHDRIEVTLNSEVLHHCYVAPELHFCRIVRFSVSFDFEEF